MSRKSKYITIQTPTWPVRTADSFTTLRIWVRLDNERLECCQCGQAFTPATKADSRSIGLQRLRGLNIIAGFNRHHSAVIAGTTRVGAARVGSAIVPEGIAASPRRIAQRRQFSSACIYAQMRPGRALWWRTNLRISTCVLVTRYFIGFLAGCPVRSVHPERRLIDGIQALGADDFQALPPLC